MKKLELNSLQRVILIILKNEQFIGVWGDLMKLKFLLFVMKGLLIFKNTYISKSQRNLVTVNLTTQINGLNT